MHLSMLSLGAGYRGREFNLPAILEDQQNLEMRYPPSWYREDFGYHAYMPTLPSNPGVSRIQNESPGLPYG